MNNLFRTVCLIDCDKSKKYTKEELSKALEVDRIKELIEKGAFYGEYCRPIKDVFNRLVIVDISNLGFKLIRFWWSKNKLMAKIKLISYGEELVNKKLEFIPRCLGIDNKEKDIFTNIHLITFDIAFIIECR